MQNILNKAFEDYNFNPQLTPRQMLEAGIFGGAYFADTPGGPKQYVIENIPMEIWDKLPEHLWTLEKPISAYNKYHTMAGKDQVWWEQRGLIVHEHDPRGWFEWYCKFFHGRRIQGYDEWQIQRQRSFLARQLGLLRSYVVKNNCSPSNYPRLCQAILQWAHDPETVLTNA